MSKGFRGIFGVFFLLMSVAAFAQMKIPSVKLGELSACMKIVDSVLKRSCSFEDFQNKIKDFKTKDPSVSYLVARWLYEDLLDVKSGVMKEAKIRKSESATVIDEIPAFVKYFFGTKEEEIRTTPPKYNPEAVLISRTREHIELIEKWTLPSIGGRSVLEFELAQLLVRAYGETLRFSSAQSFLAEHQKLLFKYSAQKLELLKTVAKWVNEYGAYPLRDWLGAELIQWRSDKITGRSERDFFLWSESLLLAGRPQSRTDRRALLETLRQLWIVYPNSASQSRLREITETLGVSHEFKAPSVGEMNLEELIAHARAWVKEVEADKARNVLNFVFRLPSWKRSDEQKLWEAFSLHIKVYRILDQRPLIPALIQRYLEIKRFLKLSKSSPTLGEDIDRMLQIARWYWTYERVEEAKHVLKAIVDFNRKNNLEYSMADANYILARISEQSFAKKSAIEDMTHALDYGLSKNMRSTLLWGRMFLKWEQFKKAEQLKGLLEDLKLLKPLIEDDEDQRKWDFWYARVQKLLGNTILAKKSFLEVYESDPFSFYGALAGVALKEMGVEPKGWTRRKAVQIEEPKWSKLFDDNGNVHDDSYESLAKMYYLARAGDLDGARSYFSNVDASAWRYILQKKHSKANREQFSRAVAWLREELKDPMGSLRMAEISRQAFGNDVGDAEIRYLYPLAYWEFIDAESKANQTNPWVVVSLIRQESAFNENARSWANALGLMQMIPPVAEDEASRMKLENFQSEDLFKPEIAVKIGVHHLSRLISSFNGSLICSYASYNAGAPPVQKWLTYYPESDPLMFIERISYDETKNYVKKLLRNYINYQRFYGDTDIRVQDLLKMPDGSLTETFLSFDG